MLDEYWPMAELMIKAAQQRYEHQYGLDDVLAGLRAGRAVLWIVSVDSAPVAAMTTSVEVYPRRRSLVIELLGGEALDVWGGAAIEELAEIAKASGYDAIETKARLGWQKMARKHGFQVKHVAYEMELN